MDLPEILKQCQVPHDKKIRLTDFDTAWSGEAAIPKDQRKKLAEKHLAQELEKLSEAQELLYAADEWSILMIFQALDAAGKDSTIKHVMSGVNPQGCQVFSFKHPSTEELDHNFLWRCMKALPERGRIGIFNRSYYEEVLIVKVHSDFVKAQRIPGAKPTKDFWNARYEDINNFERHLTRNGTKVLKFFLNVSREEQRARFLERIEDPTKQWKFSAQDLREREHWDAYQAAYEETLNATSTKWAPWYVIPADRKWVSRTAVAKILTHTIKSLGISFPEISQEKAIELEESKRQLLAEH